MAGKADTAPFASVLRILDTAATRHGLEPALLRALAFNESSFNALAVSHVGAKGLCQLMDATARELGVKDSFDPEQNANGAAKYLARLSKKYGGDVDATLAAYCWGPGKVDRTEDRAKWPASVKVYVQRVKARAELERAADSEPPPAPRRCPLCGSAVDTRDENDDGVQP